MTQTVWCLRICCVWFIKLGSKWEGRPGLKSKQSLEGTVRAICWVAVVAQGRIKARSSSKQDQDRGRIQHQFRALVSELCRSIMGTLWCFSKLFSSSCCFGFLTTNFVQLPSCLSDGKICLILCALISTEVSLWSCFQLSIHRSEF